VVEFALIFPVLLFLLVGVADFGRLYTSAVAIESAVREAADYGAFQTNRWDPANVSTTVEEMQRRACVAAAGSHLQDYATSDPSNSTCSNPSFQCWLEHSGVDVDCGTSGGMIAGTDCAASATEPPCTVHVRLDFNFRTILQVPIVPGTIQLVRESRFRISDLAPPP
jgi:Flp pilus assembly protein TadG